MRTATSSRVLAGGQARNSYLARIPQRFAGVQRNVVVEALERIRSVAELPLHRHRVHPRGVVDHARVKHAAGCRGGSRRRRVRTQRGEQKHGDKTKHDSLTRRAQLFASLTASLFALVELPSHTEAPYEPTDARTTRCVCYVEWAFHYFRPSEAPRYSRRVKSKSCNSD
jgi:hypothetical protein